MPDTTPFLTERREIAPRRPAADPKEAVHA